MRVAETRAVNSRIRAPVMDPLIAVLAGGSAAGRAQGNPLPKDLPG
jgi:hypothetical protein